MKAGYSKWRKRGFFSHTQLLINPVSFELIDRPAYVAVGLSYDDKMGDDSVIECVPESGTVKAFSSWTRVGPYGVTRSGIVSHRSSL